MRPSTPPRLASYRLRERLGKGSYGEVYKALDLERGRLVALKMVRLSEQEYRAFQKEAHFLKSLSHPHIVPLLDVLRHQHLAVLVLEYQQGGSLQALVDKEPLPEPLAARFIKQILQGLTYLHARNIAHRDIKAANILLNKHGDVKLADFGIAKQLGGEAAGESAKGSPYWMAPEVISLGEVTTKCDIWSLGCTAIELMTGKCPYSQLLPYPAMIRIVQDPHPPLPKVSAHAQAFLLACFTKGQSSRPSPTELLKQPWLCTEQQVASDDCGEMVADLVEARERGDATYEEQMLRRMVGI